MQYGNANVIVAKLQQLERHCLHLDVEKAAVVREMINVKNETTQSSDYIQFGEIWKPDALILIALPIKITVVEGLRYAILGK